MLTAGSEVVAGTSVIMRLRPLVEKTAARLLPSPVLNVCEHDRRLAIERRVGSAEHHLMVRNGIPDVDPVFRSDPAADPPHLVMIARFVPQKDHHTLLTALARLIDSPRLRAEMGAEGRKRYELELTADRMLADVAALFRRLIAGERPARSA